MAHSARHPQWSKRLLGLATAVLVVASLVPLRFTGWLGGLGSFVDRVLAPVSHPASQFASWVAGGATATLADPAQDEIAQLETINRQLLAENQRLRDTISDLQAGLAYARRPVVPVVASVIARSSDPSSPALTIRAGRVHGVDVNNTAVVRGVQIVGRVERVSQRTSVIRPITDPSYGPISAVVEVENASDLTCQLVALDDGSLRGPLISEYEGPQREPRLPEVGATVRLTDPAWPESSQMLVIGEVTRVEQDPDQPLRYLARVRPTTDLSRVAEVILRTLPGALELEEGEGPTR